MSKIIFFLADDNRLARFQFGKLIQEVFHELGQEFDDWQLIHCYSGDLLVSEFRKAREAFPHSLFIIMTDTLMGPSLASDTHYFAQSYNGPGAVRKIRAFEQLNRHVNTYPAHIIGMSSEAISDANDIYRRVGAQLFAKKPSITKDFLIQQIEHAYQEYVRRPAEKRLAKVSSAGAQENSAWKAEENVAGETQQHRLHFRSCSF